MLNNIMALIIVASLGPSAAAEQTARVRSPVAFIGDHHSPSEISRTRAYLIYVNIITRWPDGREIRVFMYGFRSSQFRLLSTSFRISHKALATYIRRGRENSAYRTNTVVDEYDMVNRVSSVEGGFGYVPSRQMFIIKLPGGVKWVRVY